ncbi:MAG: S41 family peptidase [Bacteroidetes bacterium]|nr:S41 family peptidase [Bacteroidota bacterium]MDA1121460.1 S41 family peptidase [Bacteroidota bacterium]
MSEIKNSRHAIRLPFFLAIAIATGILIGANMVDSDTRGSLFGGVDKFREIISYVERNYVDDVDTEDLVETAITSMLKKLDPHSVYIPVRDLELSKSQLEGKFDGIGIEFNIFKDTIYVVAPLSGGPSEKVGLLSGDKIISVDGENAAGIGITNRIVFDLLRGPKGTEVVVEIMRRGDDELLTFNIIRDKIPQSSVDASYMIDEQVGYIKVSRFSATTYDEFKEALTGLNGKGMEKLVLDLTGNPGGYMDRAVDMADELISGDKMIVYTEGREPRYNSEHRADRDGGFEKGAVIVLIDQGSASASEIVAGAIQDNDRGLIVGRRSFGKGLVQMPINLRDGSELRLTISRYYTPSGRSIQKPYSEDLTHYEEDLYDRFNNGETFYKDSMKVDESMKFETLKGRVVYGGGGIVPDVFVSLDTLGNSKYLTRLFTSNTIGEFVLNYYNTNQASLEKMGFDQYHTKFEVTEAMIKDITALGESNEIKFNENQLNTSKDLLKLNVKAQIARRVWGGEGFYPIYNETNEILQEALKQFDKAEQLAKN